MKNRRCRFPLTGGVALALILGPSGPARADTIYKTDTATLNTPADWVGGTNASLEHIGRFDSALSVANAANLSLGADLALGGMLFLNTLKGPLAFAAGDTLTLGASGVNMAIANQPVTFNNDILLRASQSWNTAGRILTNNGVLSGSADVTLTKLGTDMSTKTLVLTASNTFAGTVWVKEGVLHLINTAGSLSAADVLVTTGASFRVSCPSNYFPAAGNRGKSVTLNAGQMGLSGPGVTNISEVFSGPLKVGPGYSEVIAVPDASPNKNVRLTFSRLERSPGSAVLLHGTGIGDTTLVSLGAKKANIVFDEAPALVGGGGAYGTPTVSILPQVFSNPYSSEPPYYFATYDPAYGVRQVKDAAYATTILDGSVSSTNARLTSAVTLAGPTTLNALILAAGGRVEGPGTLTVTSGGLIVTANSSIGTNTPGALAFGDAEAFLGFNDKNNSLTLTVGSAVTGTAGLNKLTYGNLTLLGPVDVGGPIHFAIGKLTVGSAVSGDIHLSRTATLDLLPGSVVNGDIGLNAGTLNLASGSTVTGTVSASSFITTSAATVSTVNNGGGTVVGALFQNGGTLNLSSNAVVNGSITAVGATVNATNSTVTGSLSVGSGATANLHAGLSLQGELTILSGGTINLNAGGLLAGSLTNSGTFNYNSTSAEPVTLSLDGPGAFNYKNTVVPLTLFQPSGAHEIGSTTAAGLSLLAGGSIILDGDPDATTVVNKILPEPARTSWTMNNGTWIFNPLDQNRVVSAEVTLNGGVLTIAPGTRRLAFYTSGATNTLTITGGVLMDQPDTDWSMRFGNYHGSWEPTGCDFIGVQTGGTVLVQGVEYFGLGSAANQKTATYDLSGGTVYAFGRNTANAVSIGSGTNNSLSAFTLRGSGKLVSSGRIYGNRAEEGANQVFAFQGGTLATASYEAANLRPEPGGARGTLFNGGGTLAPGDFGVPGRTLVTGGYTSAPNAVIALDIGGTAQATTFTNAPDSYDHFRITGDTVLDGALRVSLIHGFLPGPASVFYAVSCDNPILFPSGGFSNAPDNQLWAEDGFTRFDLTYPEDGKHVVLGGAALNQWAGAAGGDWDAAGAWSLTNPATAEFGAYFGPNLSAAGTVTAGSGRTLRGLAFHNAASYTLAGPGALTLASGGAYGMPRILSLLGSHTVSAALVLQDALTVDVTNAADTLTLAGGVTGGKGLTKLGAGTLSLAGHNVLGAVTVSAGTAAQAGGVSAFAALDVAAGGVYRLASGTLTLAEGLTVATGGAFDFARYGGGTLRLARGAAGGAVDTLAEFWEAVGDGRVTVKGQAAADPSLFIIKEEESGGVWYVTVTLKSFGTLLQFR